MIKAPSLDAIYQRYFSRFPEDDKGRFYWVFATLMMKRGLFRKAGAIKVDGKKVFYLFWYGETDKRFLVPYVKIGEKELNKRVESLDKIISELGLDFLEAE